jgi:hypothetical protein
MKRIFLFLLLVIVPLTIPSARAQTLGTTGVMQVSVSTSDVPIVIDTQSQYIVIRENSESPSNAFLIKMSGSVIYQRIPAGASFSFASSTAYPFKSGTTVANIKLVTGGPVNFTITESPSAPALVTLRGGGSGGGGGGDVTSVAGRTGSVTLSSSDIAGLANSATTDTTDASNIGAGTLNPARLPNPSATTLGGIKSKASISHQFIMQIGTDGSVVSAQPAAADVSGLVASATTDTTNASNIASGTLNHARLPTLLSGDIPNNAANTSGTAANLSGSPALPNGTSATTQSQADGSTKLATTSYVDTGLAGKQTNVFSDRSVAGTTDTVVTGDRAGRVKYGNPAPVAVTLPQAGTTGFVGFYSELDNEGVGEVTVTPTTSTINGNPVLLIEEGQSCDIFVTSAGTNYAAHCSDSQITLGANLTPTRTPHSLQIDVTGLAPAPADTAATPHLFFNQYVQSTGILGAAQPVEADVLNLSTDLGNRLTTNTVTAFGPNPTSIAAGFIGGSGQYKITLASPTTVSAVTNSTFSNLCGAYQVDASPTFAEDCWQWKNILGSGINDSSTLTFSHFGTSGKAFVAFPFGVQSGTGGNVTAVANDVSTGTTVNLLAKITSTGALKIGTTDRTTPVFIVSGGDGIAGNAQLTVAGLAKCVMDATNASGVEGQIVFASPTTAARCTTSATAPNANVWIVGVMGQDSTTSGSAANVIVGAGSRNLNLNGNGAKVQTTNAGATVNGDIATYDANGNTQDSGSTLAGLGTVQSGVKGQNTIYTGTGSGTTIGPAPDGCMILDFAICTSAVDGSGNPSFIAQGSAGNNLTITGTSLVVVINGVRQTGTGTYTDALTGLGSSSYNYIYAKLDSTNANFVAADFAKTTLAPVYSYTTPTACTGASGTAPQYWFDLSSRQWKVSTAAACSFSAASPQVVFLGVVWITATPTVSGVAHEPFLLSPYRRYEMFGDGFDALNAGTDITKQEKTSGTTTINDMHTYTSFELTGATVSPTIANNNGATSGMTIVYSQNPVLIVNTSSYTATALGRVGANGNTGAGSGGTNGGFSGAAGAGGGGGTAAGGAGGGRQAFYNIANNPGQSTGGAINTVGGNATATPTGVYPICVSQFNFALVGGSGGGGGGDGTHAGGNGGAGGGGVVLRAPGIVVDSGSSFTANGGNGVTPGTANAGGGGAGGGGTVAACGGYYSIAGTFSASAGTIGSGAGTGGAGGTATVGIAQKVKLW